MWPQGRRLSPCRQQAVNKAEIFRFMKRLFALAAILTCALPQTAFAAFNTVTLTTSAVISVGGYTLNVSGSSAVIQSIVVNVNNFSVTLASGSSFTVSSPTRQQLSADVTSDVSTNTCNGSASSISLAYSGGGTVTNAITPSATICVDPVASGGNTTGGGGQIVGSGPTAPGFVNLNSAASPGAKATSTVSTKVFTRNLKLGSKGEDVRALQQYLNAHGLKLAEMGPGSPAHETPLFGKATQYQLGRFQRVNGIAPAQGYFGPKTRAYIIAHP